MFTFFTRERIFLFAVVLICLFIIYPYLLPLSLGISLAYLFEPITDKIKKILNYKKPIWDLVLSIVIIIFTLFAVLAPILSLIITGIQELIYLLNNFETNSSNTDFFRELATHIKIFFEKFGINYSIKDIMEKGTYFLKSGSQSIASGVGSAISATPDIIIKTVIMILTWCLFSIRGRQYRTFFLPKIIPWREQREIIAGTVSSIFKALIVANILVSALQALLITIMFASFGLPRYALLGVISFFFSFIPIVGTTPLILSTAAWSYFYQERLGAAVGILICGGIVSLLDNVSRPYLMKESAQLSFFWIFLAIVGGLSQFGIAGAVLGPACFALFAAAIKTLESSDVLKKEEK